MFRAKLLPTASLLCFLLAVMLLLPDQGQRQALAAESGSTDIFDAQMLYLPFEGSALDASGKSNHGTPSAPLTFPQGQIGGQAADLANGYIGLDASKFKFGSSQSFTVSFWMKADGSLMNDTAIIANKDWASGANPGWEIGMERSKLTVNYKGASANRVDLSKTFTVGDDQWHHIAVSYDRSSKASVYVDNALKGTLTIAGSGSIDTALNLNIGADGKQNLPYTGKLDDFRIFTKALSANEVKTLYQLKANLRSSDAPLWPVGGKLDGQRYGLYGYRIAWNSIKPQPNAADAAGVTQYHVFKDNVLLASVDSSVTSYSAASMPPGDTSVYRVEASDRIGNRTSNGPEASYTVPSVLQTWPEDAKLSVTPVGSGGDVELTWPTAFDASLAAITQYRVTINGTPFPIITSGQQKLIVRALRPGTTYAIEVEAGDGTGYWAKPSLAASYKSSGPPAACPAPIADLLDLDFSGSMTQDASPRNAVVAAVGDPVLVMDPTLGRQVLSLNGTSQYIRVPHAAELNPSGQLTLLTKLSYDDLTSLLADPSIVSKVNTGGYGISLGRTDALLSGVTSSKQDNYRTVKTRAALESSAYYDVAVTFNGTVQVLYINGMEVGRVQSPGVIDYHSSLGKTDLLIGARSTNGSMSAVSGFFKGKIAYAKLFSQALTAEQLGCYYKATGLMQQVDAPIWSADSKLTVEPVDRSTYRVSWSPSGDPVVTQYRIYWNGRVLATVDASTNTYTLSGIYPGNHRLWVEAGSSNGLWSVNGPWLALPDVGSMIAAEPGMAPDLLELLFARSAAEDSSLGKHHGTAVGGAVVRYNPQLGKNTLALDGSGAYVRIPHQPELSPDFLSVAASFLLEDKYRPQTIIGKKQQSDYALEYNPVTGKLEAWFYIQDVFGAKSFVVVESRAALPVGQVVHAVATYDGMDAKLYLNGAEVGRSSRSGAIGRFIEGDLAVGASLDTTGAADNYMKGNIGVIQLFSKVLDAAGVASLYDAYTATYKPQQISSIRWGIDEQWSVGKQGQAIVYALDGSGAQKELTQGLVYQSLNPEIVAISDTGRITPLAKGTARLVAQYGAWSAGITVNVNDRIAQSIVLSGPSEMLAGQQAKFVTKVTYGNGTEEMLSSGVTYATYQDKLLAVDSLGMVTALVPGQAYVHAEWKGLSADQLVIIKPQLPNSGTLASLLFSGPTVLRQGQYESTVIQAVYSDQSIRPLTGPVLYTSSNPEVAVIDSVSGAVYAHNPGKVTFTAVYQTANASYSMEVLAAPDSGHKLKSLVMKGPSQVKLGERAMFVLQAFYENTTSLNAVSLDVTDAAQWLVMNKSVLRMDGTGRMTAVGEGTSVVKAVYQDREALAVVTVKSPGALLPGGGGANGGGSGAGGSNDNSSSKLVADGKSSYELRAYDWREGTGQAKVLLADEVSKVVFPIPLMQLKSRETLRLEHKNVKLEISGDFIQAIAVHPAVQGSPQGRLSISFPAVSISARDAWEKVAANQPVKLNLEAPMYDVQLAVEQDPGAAQAIAQWTEPMQVEFPFPSGADKALLGVYRLFADGSMTYVGGKLSESGIRADLRESGKYALLEYRKPYVDVPTEHWAYRTIQTMSAQHHVEGSDEGYFHPDQPISRAEFIALTVKSLGIQPSTVKPKVFEDVPAQAWYASHIEAAVGSGLIQGKEGNRFDPDAMISREEMAVLLTRASGHVSDAAASGQSQTFTDGEQIASWSQEAVQLAAHLGLMQGRDYGRFAPQATTTRAEAVQAMQRVLAVKERRN
ncbi:hypothetical protein GK047_13245 [Paenibacillus sp. SYP-B3998]|uniref:S-layer homology domain-containing protein n=1 Tax=Paenibacillus sp. SYP-B3998 TaxID=2678564 RepID=A0A6G3ZY03_9BACL|nr:LamG-like jellyroll fold domain-containing protein [Paenibacillus sp. SYP-B3998]NEW06970.1 hypothetical protein [Paenibacillus sp. SYP-B3998]